MRHNNFGDYGYNLMEVEYYTDLQVAYQYSDEINVFIGARNLSSVKSLQLHTMHLHKTLTMPGIFLVEPIFMVVLKSHYNRV